MTNWFNQMSMEFLEYAKHLREEPTTQQEKYIASNIEDRVKKIRRAKNNERAKEKMDVEPNF